MKTATNDKCIKSTREISTKDGRRIPDPVEALTGLVDAEERNVPEVHGQPLQD
jgi:hypothetical protein